MKKYEESLKMCILLARVSFFTVSCDPTDEYQWNLANKILKIQSKIEKNQKYAGFFGGRYNVKWYQQVFTKFAVALGFSRFNLIYRLPGFYGFENANPRMAYQKWCAAFDGVLKESDIEMIVTAAINNNDNFYEYGLKAWEDIQLQKQWSFGCEIVNIISSHFKK